MKVRRLATDAASDPATSIGTALWSASATWCAPTATQCGGWGGDAMLAALPTFHWGDVPYLVRVSYRGRSVVVRIVSRCWCGIDISPAAFAKLADLGVGRIPVEVEGPIAPLPATDGAP